MTWCKEKWVRGGETCDPLVCHTYSVLLTRCVHVDRITGILHGRAHVGAEHQLQPCNVALGAVAHKHFVGLDQLVVQCCGDLFSEFLRALLGAISTAIESIGRDRTCQIFELEDISTCILLLSRASQLLSLDHSRCEGGWAEHHGYEIHEHSQPTTTCVVSPMPSEIIFASGFLAR